MRSLESVIEEIKEKKKNAKEKAERLRNAHNKGNFEDQFEEKHLDPFGAIERGKQRYGS